MRLSFLSSFFSLLLLILVSPLLAQTEVDSLRDRANNARGIEKIDVLNALATRLITIDPKEALEICDEVIFLTEEVSYSKGKINALVTKATYYSRNRNHKEAQELTSQAIRLAEASENQIGKARALLIRGTDLGRQGNYDESIEQFLIGLDILKQFDEKDLEASFLLNIGREKELINELEAAGDYYTLALDIYTSENQEFRVGQTYINLGVLEYKKQNIGLSIEYNAQALTIFESLGDKAMTALSLQNLGFAYGILEDFDQALAMYDRSNSIRKEINDQFGLSRILLNKSKIYQQQGKQILAINSAEEALTIAKSIGSKQLQRDIYDFRYRLHRSNRQFETALDYFELLNKVKDSMAIEANQARISELEAAYEFEKLSNENRLQQRENEVQELQITQRNFLILGLVLLFVLLMVLFLIQRRQLRIKLELGKKDKMLLQKETELAQQRLQSRENQLQNYQQQLTLKTEMLEATRARLAQVQNGQELNQSQFDTFVQRLNESLNDRDWTKFKLYFEKAYPDFFQSLSKQAEDLTLTDQRLAALMKLNLTNKEIASTLNISPDSVVRGKHRLRQKMTFSNAQLLEDFLLKI